MKQEFFDEKIIEGKEGHKDKGRRQHFELCVEDVFHVKGRGVVITGKVIKGTIHIEDEIYWHTKEAGLIKARVTGIEMFRKLVDEAIEGDNVGLLLSGLRNNEPQPGDVVRSKQ